MEDLRNLHLSCKEEREQAQEFARHLGWSGLEWERERRRIMGTGRSINQQIFIEQLPWLAAGASSAGGRHIRKLSIKRWLWGRGRDVFFWNRIEPASLLCCLAREVGTVHMAAVVMSTSWGCSPHRLHPTGKARIPGAEATSGEAGTKMRLLTSFHYSSGLRTILHLHR